MPSKRTPEGVARAAALIGCDLPALLAVLEVETSGDGFLADGRPRILYERHVFHRLATDRALAAQWVQSHPDICNPKPGGYVGGAAEYSRLYRAVQLDPDAAVQSASWGLGQLMGFNWRLCGERSLLGFLLAVHNDEDVQLMLTAHCIRSLGAADELVRHDWAGFARIYNGPSYARNAYDTKLAAAFRRQSRRIAAGGLAV